MFRSKKLIREKKQEVAQVGDRKVPYTLIRSSRAKNLSMKISERSGLEVVVPHRYALSQVPRFIHEKEGWILQHISEIARKKANAPKLQDGTIISICGVPMTIRIFPTRKKSPYVREGRTLKFASDAEYYDGHEILIYANTLTDAKKALEKHLRMKAKKHFSRRTKELAEKMKVTYSRITIKGQKTRWGSCSRDKNLNFNWRLVFAAPEIIDSIIIHELAHTVHLNHSQRFYALVEQHCPHHRKYSKKLKEQQFML